MSALAALFASIACLFDLRTRRIPNYVTLVGLVTGVLIHTVDAGLGGFASSCAGAAVGFAIFLPFFALGGLGAGDVKLMAAIGAWVGPGDALMAALYGAVIGGLLAVGVGLARGYLTPALSNLGAILGFWRSSGVRPVPGMTLASSRGPRLPYALPITAGLLLVLWLN